MAPTGASEGAPRRKKLWVIVVGVVIVIAGVGIALFILSVPPPTPPPPEEGAVSIEYEYWDFFNVPYADHWDIRATSYTEWPMNAECFNATSVAEGICTPVDPGVPDVLDYPYAHYYSAFNPNFFPNEAIPSIWAPYRMQVTGVEVQGYNRSEPVFLPTLDYGQAPGSRLEFSWYMNYLNKSRETEIGFDCGTNFVFGNDGYIMESQVVLTMDLQQSKRMFGVVATTPAEAASWWSANTDPDCLRQRGIERGFNEWLVKMGGSQNTVGKYDIATGFEWYYQPFATNMSATVDLQTGLTTVRIDHFGYGTEVLLARMFYWGNTSYEDHYLDSTKRTGWWGMENAWFEDFRFSGVLDVNRMNFTLVTVMQYTFQHICGPGPNGIYDRVDDTAVWRWGPFLDDYVEEFSPPWHTLSELERYTGRGFVHCTPGAPSAAYGQNLPYDYTPITWDLKTNETWTFRFPTGNVVFYDPNLTPLGAIPLLGQYIEIAAPMAVDRIVPGGFGTWDSATMTWTVTGPAATGGPKGSPGPDGVAGTADDLYPLEPWPLIDFRPRSGGGSPPIPAAHETSDGASWAVAAARPIPRQTREGIGVMERGTKGLSGDMSG